MKRNAGFTLNNPKLNTKITLETQTLVNNKQVSDYLAKRDNIKPIMEQYWVTKFNISSSRQYWSKVYTSLFDNLTRNKLIEFRYKLLNSILPCKELLFKWRLSDNPLREICHIQENYEHMFIECPIVNQLWVNVENSLRKSNLSVSVKKLQYLVVGYKPEHKEYADLNKILSLISYSIFKGYCLSENRKKYLNTLFLAKNELQKAKYVSNALKLSKSNLFNNFFEYFVRG